MLSTLILAGHWLIIVLLSLRVISRRWPVGVSSAWLVVIISVPFVGAGLYLLFGERRLGRRRWERMRSVARAFVAWQSEWASATACATVGGGPDPAAVPVAGLAEALFGFPVRCAESIDLLDTSDRLFDTLLADIDAATSRCNLSFYIWQEQGRAREIIGALLRANMRGVRCRILCDAVGSKAFLAGTEARRMREAGIEIRAALPIGLFATLFSRADLRNHRKIATIDSRIAYSGSQNLVDPKYFRQAAAVGDWVDAMVRVSGAASAALDGVFESDWAIESGAAFVAPAGSDVAADASGPAIQIAASGPGLKPEAIRQLLLSAIYGAREEIIITTPYFVPDDSILLALRSAAERGVAVTVVVPARNDSVLVRFASAACYDDLLQAGARIAEYAGGLLHTKSITIDRRTSIFGSVNVDMRSLWLNFEISLLVYDSDFSTRLRRLQLDYLGQSTSIDLDSWRARPRSRRFLEDLCRLIGPLL
jgi:cardiolipin synthase A/B